MEQLLAFILGVGTALIVWGVVVAFRTAKQVKLLQVNITDIYQVINQNEEMVNRRVDQEIDRVDLIYTNILSTLDSRLDKLDAKFCRDGKALTEKSREFLKG
jgi:hypothetical protein